MKSKEIDWLSEVWRIKRELAKKAVKMGLRKYLDFAEQEAKVHRGELFKIKKRKK